MVVSGVFWMTLMLNDKNALFTGNKTTSVVWLKRKGQMQDAKMYWLISSPLNRMGNTIAYLGVFSLV